MLRYWNGISRPCLPEGSRVNVKTFLNGTFDQSLLHTIIPIGNQELGHLLDTQRYKLGDCVFPIFSHLEPLKVVGWCSRWLLSQPQSQLDQGSVGCRVQDTKEWYCQAQVQVQVRWGSGRSESGKVQLRELKTQRFGPEQYPNFGFHHHQLPPTTTFFLAFVGSRHVR